MDIVSLNVLITKPVQKVSKKTGQPYQFLTIQGVATAHDGEETMFSYDIWPEKDQPMPVVPKGPCKPIYGCRVHWETKNLEPAFIGFQPINAKG